MQDIQEGISRIGEQMDDGLGMDDAHFQDWAQSSNGTVGVTVTRDVEEGGGKKGVEYVGLASLTPPQSINEKPVVIFSTQSPEAPISRMAGRLLELVLQSEWGRQQLA